MHFDFSWVSRKNNKDYNMAEDANSLADGIIETQQGINTIEEKENAMLSGLLELQDDVEKNRLSVARLEASELYTDISTLMTFPPKALEADFISIHNDTSSDIDEFRTHDDYAGLLNEPILIGETRLCKIFSLGHGGAEPENGFVWVVPSKDTDAELKKADIALRTRIDNLESAVNENTEKIENKANIKKNPSAEDGDIVDTHMTVGTRAAGQYGDLSFTSGTDNIASEAYSSAVGGAENVASGVAAVVLGGISNIASEAESAVLGGSTNIVRGEMSVVIGGSGNEVNNYRAVVVGGRNNIADESDSTIIGGNTCTAKRGNVVFGHFNLAPVAGNPTGALGDVLIIGNGTTKSNSNAFRVAYNGNVYCGGEYSSNGADYAEMFEWVDGNPADEDRRGLFAYIENGKMRLANSADTDRRRIGVISARPAVVGDDFDDSWCGKYMTDVFGAVMTHIVHHDAEEYTVMVTDHKTGKKVPKTEIIEAYDAVEPILNPDYDPEQEYIPRAQRKEYDCWAFMGKLVVIDDGTCEANGYCYPSENGVATAAEDGFYVLERIDETHIKVLIK